MKKNFAVSALHLFVIVYLFLFSLVVAYNTARTKIQLIADSLYYFIQIEEPAKMYIVHIHKRTQSYGR